MLSGKMFNHPAVHEPRASRIPIPGRADLASELWMGGAQAANGDLVEPGDLEDAWVIDLAGDMPEAYRAACRYWQARVFADMEQVPSDYPRLTALAESIAAAMSGSGGNATRPHPAETPRRVYVMCQQGMNRSGLLTGLILRALGVSGDEAIAAVGNRPGALHNQTYARLVREWPDGVLSADA